MYCNIQQPALTFNNQCKTSITQKYTTFYFLKKLINKETQQNRHIIEKNTLYVEFLSQHGSRVQLETEAARGQNRLKA